MIRYLINRPIATCVITITLVLLGVLSTQFIPVSLLPDLSVPEISVQANYPNADARQIQEIIATPLRNQLIQLNHLDDLEVISNDGYAVVKLKFDYGTNIDLAYLEANEKVDMLMEYFPRDMSRPRVIKAGAADIPIFHLNVTFASDTGNFIELTTFTENILRRRLEQLPEIAMVDITGLADVEVLVQPNISLLQQTGISLDDLEDLIRNQSGDLGNLVIKDGPYEYSIRFDASLRSAAAIENLFFKIGKTIPRIIRIKDLARITVKERPRSGVYTFNGKRAIGLALVKQSDAQLLELRSKLHKLKEVFEMEYKNLDFQVSQDQTELLDLSISNLVSSLLIGAALSFTMIFFFMRDKRVVFLIALVIPISLAITLLGFFVFGITINIVSLAGLVLGIGEIVDSAIIIIENIEQQSDQHNSTHSTLPDACVKGAEEVIKPLFTSVLTNSAVFLPVLFLSGIAGQFFFDQAIAVSLALGVSLLTSYALVPVLYSKIYKSLRTGGDKATTASRLSKALYNKVFIFAINRPALTFFLLTLLLFSSFWAIVSIDVEGMPDVSHTQQETYIDWNEPVSADENNRRLISIFQKIKVKPKDVGLYVGQQQFLLGNLALQSPSQTLITAKLNSPKAYDSLRIAIRSVVTNDYPNAIFETKPALNAFEQVFRTGEAPLRIMLSSPGSQTTPSLSSVDSINQALRKVGVLVQAPARRERLLLSILEEKLVLYDVGYQNLIQALKVEFNSDRTGTLIDEQQRIQILLGSGDYSRSLQNILDNTLVVSESGNLVPAANLVNASFETDYTSIYMGKNGTYTPLNVRSAREHVPEARMKAERVLSNSSFSAAFAGSYYQNLGYINELNWIILVVIVMLFFILAAQFESLQQPLIVLLVITFGISGAVLSLYLAGSSLNIMSATGIIVLVGLLDNDSILKIDTMNRSRNENSLLEVIRQGGERRLQSQLMTFLTTELGLLPILWSSGLGAELQKPLAITIIGGMALGVLISWTLIPITYYWLYRRSENEQTALLGDLP